VHDIGSVNYSIYHNTTY